MRSVASHARRSIVCGHRADYFLERLVEVAVVIGRGGEIETRHSWLIHPGRAIPAESTAIHGIKDEDVAGKPPFAAVAGEILAALAGSVPAAYNAVFDRGFLLS